MKLDEKTDILKDEGSAIIKRNKWVNVSPSIYSTLIDILNDLDKIKKKLGIE